MHGHDFGSRIPTPPRASPQPVLIRTHMASPAARVPDDAYLRLPLMTSTSQLETTLPSNLIMIFFCTPCRDIAENATLNGTDRKTSIQYTSYLSSQSYVRHPLLRRHARVWCLSAPNPASYEVSQASILLTASTTD